MVARCVQFQEGLSKPHGQYGMVWNPCRHRVGFSGTDHQPRGHAQSLALFDESPGLFHGHQRILVTMNDQNRRRGFAQVRHGGELSGKLIHSLLCFYGGATYIPAPHLQLGAEGVNAGLALIIEVSWWTKTGGGLDAAADPLQRVGGVGLAVGAAGGRHKGKMPARTGSIDA